MNYHQFLMVHPEIYSEWYIHKHYHIILLFSSSPKIFPSRRSLMVIFMGRAQKRRTWSWCWWYIQTIFHENSLKIFHGYPIKDLPRSKESIKPSEPFFCLGDHLRMSQAAKIWLTRSWVFPRKNHPFCHQRLS